MTTQHHPRPASFAGPIVFVAGLAAVAGIAAVGLTRYDRGNDSGPSTRDVSQSVWVAPAPPTAEELLQAAMALHEAQTDAIFGPLRRPVNPTDEVAQAQAEHDNAVAAYLAQTQGSADGVSVANTVSADAVIAQVVAEHDNAITATTGVGPSGETTGVTQPDYEQALANAIAEHEYRIAQLGW